MKVFGKFLASLLIIFIFAIFITAAVALCLSLINQVTFGEQLAEWFGSETFFVKWFLKGDVL